MIRHCILPEQKLIAICNWGKTSVEETLKFSRDLHEDPLFFQGYDSIVDNSLLESVYTRDELDQLAATRVDTGKPVGRVAIISPSDIQFGISRMHESVAEIKTNPIKIHVFRDSASALQWLDREGVDIEKVFEQIKGDMKGDDNDRNRLQ